MRTRFSFVALLVCSLSILSNVAHADDVSLARGPARFDRVVYTLAIGNNAAPAGHDELAPLRYADDDAVRYYEVLRHASRTTELLTVLDRRTQERFPELAQHTRPPTLAAFEQALARLRTLMHEDVLKGKRPVLFLTFSGHGAIGPDGEPFLALVNGNLTRTMLYEQVLPSLAEAQVHLIIDACHAEAAVGVRGAFDVESNANVVALNESESQTLLEDRTLERFPNVGAIVATSSEQEAHEWSRIESGVFTHEVLSAMLGAADVNGDLRVEYSEVQAFVAAANRDVPDPRAKPRIVAHAPPSDQRAVLMDLNQLNDVVLLRGRPQKLGRFHVELDNGMRWLEAHFAGDLWATLVLPAQNRAHLRAVDREAELPVGTSRFEELHFEPLASATRGSVDSAYRSNLFAVPYGRAYYVGFVDSSGMLSVPFQPRTHDQGPSRALPDPTRRIVAISLFSLAGASLAAGGVTLGLALHTKHQFEQTDLMKKSSELNDRFQLQTAASIACAGAAVLSAGLGLWVWPRARVGVTGQRGGAVGSLSWQM